jgi:hypothetical protein
MVVWRAGQEPHRAPAVAQCDGVRALVIGSAGDEVDGFTALFGSLLAGPAAGLARSGAGSTPRACVRATGNDSPPLPTCGPVAGEQQGACQGACRHRRQLWPARFVASAEHPHPQPRPHCRYRRLKIRHERRDDIHQAFLHLGCILICWGPLQQWSCWALLVGRPLSRSAERRPGSEPYHNAVSGICLWASVWPKLEAQSVSSNTASWVPFLLAMYNVQGE